MSVAKEERHIPIKQPAPSKASSFSLQAMSFILAGLSLKIYFIAYGRFTWNLLCRSSNSAAKFVVVVEISPWRSQAIAFLLTSFMTFCLWRVCESNVPEFHCLFEMSMLSASDFTPPAASSNIYFIAYGTGVRLRT